jgi:hypothetical protein
MGQGIFLKSLNKILIDPTNRWRRRRRLTFVSHFSFNVQQLRRINMKKKLVAPLLTILVGITWLLNT